MKLESALHRHEDSFSDTDHTRVTCKRSGGESSLLVDALDSCAQTIMAVLL